jgi:hypothetical protein
MKSLTFFVVVALAAPAFAQDAKPAVPLNLGELHRAAEASDPRAREVRLLQQQWELRDRNIAVQRLPSFSVESQAQYQSDVPSSPITNAAGQPLFQAPKETYDSFLRVEQRLFDPTVRRQAALQRAQLAEDQSRVRTALYALRQQVNDAFFRRGAARSARRSRGRRDRGADRSGDGDGCTRARRHCTPGGLRGD